MEQKEEIKNFHYHGLCPVRDVISRLGDKWSILILSTLRANRQLRFNEIHRSLGDISQRMLTVTLRSLQADGFIDRHIFAQVPPRVEYSLTPLGEELCLHIDPLISWATDNMETILKNRDRTL